MSLRVRIVGAFAAVSAVTLFLGLFATHGVHQSGFIVSDIFGRALIGTSYARSAAMNVALMGVAFAEWRLAAPAEREGFEQRLADLAEAALADLRITTERADTAAVRDSANRAKRAVDSWYGAVQEALRAPAPHHAALSRLADDAQEQLEVLVNLYAGDAFRQRQRAIEAIANTRFSTAIGTAVALLLSAAASILLTKRIIGPIASASDIAASIASGQLDRPVQPGGKDEIGVLLACMEKMRLSIQAMIGREQEQRRNAQEHLADAMEGSTDGVVLADADGRIVAVNARATELLPGVEAMLQPGENWSQSLHAGLGRAPASEVVEARVPSLQELRRHDGAWLRLSLSPAREGGSVAILSDISDLKQQEEALAEVHRRITAALGSMSQGLCMVSAGQQMMICNDRFTSMFRLPPPEALTDRPVHEVFRMMIEGGAFPANLLASIEAEHAELTRHGGQHSFLRVGPNDEALAVSHVPIPGGGWLATYEDTTEKRRAEERVAFLAHHDALTGLPNRTLLRDRAEQAIGELGRGRGFAILCLDLDRFKIINDTLGHAIGDLLLRAVAERLSACCRVTDTVARLGGDEFVILQTPAETPEATDLLGKRILEAMAEPFDLAGHQLAVGTSIGVAIAPHDGSSVERLLRSADAALYRAKQDGRAAIRFFKAEMDAGLEARRQLEFDLRKALAGHELDLLYQPLVNLAQGRVCAFEALIRWRHPQRGMVSPAEFIPVVEEMGLIIPIGEWVLRRACRDAVTWPDGVRVAVNVSPIQFKAAGLVELVMTALSESGLAASRLELEITESVMLQDGAMTMSTLQQLHNLGVRIAMDDFGTGYSSLSYLRSFPFDKIKIDQSFIRELVSGSPSAAIVRAITGLGSSLSMRTTAEGVETEAQLQMLQAEGCTEVQGYFFGKPGPADAVHTTVAKINERLSVKKPAT